MDMPEAEGGHFVSYPRQESAHLAGRLYDRLADRFGEGRVFIDVDAIELGVVIDSGYMSFLGLDNWPAPTCGASEVGVQQWSIGMVSIGGPYERQSLGRSI